jgi:predicted CXXCH cytochrome family protein
MSPLKKILPALLAALVIITWSCSHKTLSIFFDGVPDPNDTIANGQAYSGNNSNKETGSTNPRADNLQAYFYHPPYQEKECASCHDPKVMGQLLQSVPGLCYQCHDDFATKYKTLHAPVEGGECLSCHSPHLALYKNLLKRPGRQVCFECHDQADILSVEPHTDLDNETVCTDCHNPHGGEDEYILN